MRSVTTPTNFSTSVVVTRWFRSGARASDKAGPGSVNVKGSGGLGPPDAVATPERGRRHGFGHTVPVVHGVLAYGAAGRASTLTPEQAEVRVCSARSKKLLYASGQTR